MHPPFPCPRLLFVGQFLDKAKIKAILINEGITMHRVVFYLAFVVTGRDKMVVAFENLKPRLHILVKIYRLYCSNGVICPFVSNPPPLEIRRFVSRLPPPGLYTPVYICSH